MIEPSGGCDRWDSACVANPVVLAPKKEGEEWLCFYYGNNGSWANGVPCFLPTGSTGLARSPDGIEWTKVDGHEPGAAVFGPGAENDWDGLHTGVGDVVRLKNGTLLMFYFGASAEEVSMGPQSVAGLRMNIGRAVSEDEGLTWQRDPEPVLKWSSEEGLFCSWPRIVPPLQGEGDEEEEWRLLYHAFDGKSWRVFTATSTDSGRSWERGGLILEGGDEAAFDSMGIGTRAVVRRESDLLMIFEGVSRDTGLHSLGAATSEDGGKTWAKLLDGGGPVVVPGGAAGQWTEQVVGTPFLVPMPDGALRLYFCAKESPAMNMSIGCLVSPDGKVGPDDWKPAA